MCPTIVKCPPFALAKKAHNYCSQECCRFLKKIPVDFSVYLYFSEFTISEPFLFRKSETEFVIYPDPTQIYESMPNNIMPNNSYVLAF